MSAASPIRCRLLGAPPTAEFRVEHRYPLTICIGWFPQISLNFSRASNVFCGGKIDLHPSLPRHTNSALLKCGESLLTLEPFALGPVVGVDVGQRDDLYGAEHLHPEDEIVRADESTVTDNPAG
jgi:hypothetical protein